jgi:hypothetical protein
MSQPISQAVIPPQPGMIAYGVQELALFETYTRDSYASAFGAQAPAWDPARLRKNWFDSKVDTSDAGNVAVYRIVAPDSAGNWGIRQMVIPAQEAATVNLPGVITYPAYTVPGTGATRGGQPINPNYLSLERDARALMAAVGGDSLVDEGNTAVFPVSYPPDEPRRMWAIVYHGTPLNAGIQLLNQNAAGVGAPGHWLLSPTEPVWVPAPPAPTGIDDTRPPRAMPSRDLLANEKLQTGLMGIGVIRTDLVQQQAEQSGQFTGDDRATLQQIYQILNRLAG